MTALLLAGRHDSISKFKDRFGDGDIGHRYRHCAVTRNILRAGRGNVELGVRSKRFCVGACAGDGLFCCRHARTLSGVAA